MKDLGYGKDYKWQADFKPGEGFFAGRDPLATKLKYEPIQIDASSRRDT